ncbi:hypothetical protein F3B35_24985 [Bacteroides intestinalis]|nr:hypothetical protein F3B35_24985 [Bacteroides intestinalis]
MPPCFGVLRPTVPKGSTVHSHPGRGGKAQEGATVTRLFRCEVCRCQYCFSYSRLTSKVTPPASHGYTLRVAALPPVVTRASRVLCSRRARPSFVRPWSMGSKARRRFSYSRRTSPPYPLSYSVNFFLFSSQRKAPATIRPRTG